MLCHIDIMNTKKITLLAILLSTGIVLQIFENYLPIISIIPGGKLGIANIVTMLCINLFDVKTSFILCVLRPVLSATLYGGITQMFYGLAGGLLSFVFMAFIIKKCDKFSYIGAGIIGASAHNVAQIAVAVLMYSNTYIFTYLPVLLILSLISGYFTGFCSTIIIQKYKDRKNVKL